MSDGEKRRGENKRSCNFPLRLRPSGGSFRSRRKTTRGRRTVGRTVWVRPSFPSGENFPLSEWTETWPEAEVAEGTNERRDGKVKRERGRTQHGAAADKVRWMQLSDKFATAAFTCRLPSSLPPQCQSLSLHTLPARPPVSPLLMPPSGTAARAAVHLEMEGRKGGEKLKLNRLPGRREVLPAAVCL